MKRQTFAARALSLAFLLLAAASLAACSKIPKHAATLDKPAATLTLALRAGTYADVIKSCLPAFQQQYNVICNVLELGEEELHRRVADNSSSENGDYDFCMVDGSWMAEYTAKGVLANLSEFGYELDDDIISATKAICYHNGGLYLAPYYGNVTVLLYNKLMLKEAGFAPESMTTLEDMLTVCKFQKKRHNLGFLYRGDTANNVVVDFLPILCSYGGWVVDERNAPTINTPVFRAACETYKELIETGRAVKKDDLIAAIANKAAVIGIGWPGWYTPTRNSSMDYLALTGQVASGSVAYNANIYGIWTVGIPANSIHKDYAVQLLAYLMDKEVQKTTIAKGGVPCRYSSLQDAAVLEKFPQYATVCKALEGGVYRPVMEKWSDFYTILGKHLKAAFDGKVPIADALAAAQLEVEDMLQEE